MKTESDVVALLRALRWRLAIQEAFDSSSTWSLALGGLTVLASGASRACGGEPISAVLLIIGMSVASALASIVAVLRPRADEQVAMLIDQRGQTKDRLLTALHLRSRTSTAQLDTFAVKECLGFLASRDLRRYAPIHPPPGGRWLIVPLLCLFMLQLDAERQRVLIAAEAQMAQKALAPAIRELEEVRRKAAAAAAKAGSVELKRLAEQMQQSLARLRNEERPQQADKARLQEVSKLEELLRELQRRPSQEAELSALARSLASLPGMDEVIRALDEKNLAAALKALTKAREKQASSPTAQLAEEQIRDAIGKAMQRLSQQRKLSDAMQQLGREMTQANSRGLTQQALDTLAKMMKQANQQGNNAPGEQASIQDLIAALENARQSSTENEPSDAPAQGSGDGKKFTMEEFNASRQPGTPQLSDSELPSGMPGSERDSGTTASPFGEMTEPQDKRGALALKGQLGEGEALSRLLPSAGDRSNAGRRYQELYESARAAAESAVQQENIPLGSRYLIRRYFESIRP